MLVDKDSHNLVKKEGTGGPERLHQIIPSHITQVFTDKLKNQSTFEEGGPTKTFAKKRQDHPKMEEFLAAREKQDLEECCEIQEEIRRGSWRALLISAQALTSARVGSGLRLCEGGR